MIYISCSDEEFEGIVKTIEECDFCYIFNKFGGCSYREFCNCEKCIRENIKRINTDITPDEPKYSTEAENTAFLQGFNVAVKKMRGEM